MEARLAAHFCSQPVTNPGLLGQSGPKIVYEVLHL